MTITLRLGAVASGHCASWVRDMFVSRSWYGSPPIAAWISVGEYSMRDFGEFPGPDRVQAFSRMASRTHSIRAARAFGDGRDAG